MPRESEGGRQIAASLVQRAGPSADIAKTAQAVTSTLQDMDTALAPIIGHQGVAALYRRSLHLCIASHPRMASIYDNVQNSLDPAALQAVLVEQSEADVLFFGEALLTTFYELLTTLIGPPLTARLLRGVCGPSSSNTPSQENAL